MISLVIIGLYAASVFFLDPTIRHIFVPPYIAILASVTACMSLGAYLWASQRYIYGVVFTIYILLVLTVGLLIESTGRIQSPFIALWMLLVVLSGVFGLVGHIGMFLVTNAALLYYLFFDSVPYNSQHFITILVAAEVPIIVSYLIWHERRSQDNQKSNAIDALTKELSQVANKSEIVINAIADGVLAIDTKGIIQLINPAAQTILGWSKQDALGLDYRSVLKLSDVNGQELTDTNSPIQQVLKTNKLLINNDLTLTTKSGKKILLSLVVSPVGGSVPASGTIAVFRDITNEKLEERQQAEFISTASHEMRTPVAAIEGYLGLALNPSTAAIDDKARVYLQKAHEATQHLGRLFQDLLTVSRAEDGRVVPKPTALDIVNFMREITESFLQRAKEKGLELHFKPGTSNLLPDGDNTGSRTIAPVYYGFIDSGHLREIVNNLLDNAIKYTLQGSVEVDITGDDTSITLSIKDTGMGVPPEDVSHLFQKFYRIDNSDTREIGGTGLGLYICRRLVETNNGHIWVESVYGKGSTFYVQFPRLSHEEATTKLQQEAAQPPQATQPVISRVAPISAMPPATAALPVAPPAQPPVQAKPQPVITKSTPTRATTIRIPVRNTPPINRT